MTRILVDLGAARFIVGRTRYCESVDPDIPVIGDLNQIYLETLVRIEPTHLVLQSPATGTDPALRRIAAEHGWILYEKGGLNSINDVAQVVTELGQLFKDVEIRANAESLSAQLREIDVQARSNESASGARVLVVTVDPGILAFGRDTYLDVMLRAHGLRNAVAEEGWITLTLEDVARLEPDGLLIVKPRAAEERDGLHLAGSIAELEIPAMTEHRIGVIRHPDALLPSTSLLEVYQEMADQVDSWGGGSS